MLRHPRPQLTEPANLPPAPFNQTGVVFPNSTIRQTLHVSIRISNAFGITDLPITAVTVALPFNGSAGVSAIESSTLQSVSFSGSPSITIPNGALAVSDPLNFRIASRSIISVSIYFAAAQQSNAVTSHPGSRTTSWFQFGNAVNAMNLTDSSVRSVAHWYFLSAVEAWAPDSSRTFAIVGDSITDGRGSDTDHNDRWPDLLLAKMQKSNSIRSIAVVNQAAGSNRILADGLGPNTFGRIGRDVLAQSGVKYSMIFEGVNDIGVVAATEAAQSDIYNRLIAAYQQIITQVHTFGIPMFAATITPFGAPNSTIQPYSDPLRDQTRRKVNDWILNSGKFDAVVDFDAILKDPANFTQLNPLYNSGDYLHPNEAGYQHVADQFPLSIFDRFTGGVSSYT